MIVKKTYLKETRSPMGFLKEAWYVTGWYLLGIIPLYVIKEKVGK